MAYKNQQIAEAASALTERLKNITNKAEILRAPELKALYDILRTLPGEEKRSFGQELNQLKQSLEEVVNEQAAAAATLPPLDVTAPVDINAVAPVDLPAENGTMHPLTREIKAVIDIFNSMGFTAVGSRELDDDYHMFSALNFPEGHPARDDYDTFMTIQTDKNGKPLIAPAHTSTMQNRVLKQFKANLTVGQPIAVLVPDRVFRNEDVDARHDHTFYQFEGVYVDKGVTVGNLIATLKTFLQTYYGKSLEVKTQPYYFPFTEPSFEFALSCPFCDKQGCSICSHTGWIELLGCGMMHPNVLREAGIDPEVYTGFAWGGGIERLVMMRNGIEDIRYFESAKLEFLRQFA